MDTVGGVVSLVTVTLTAAEVARLPAASEARALRAWTPLAAAVEFHVKVKTAGANVPTTAPSTRESIRVTPTLSGAVAVRVTLPGSEGPARGAGRATEGA